VVEGYWLGLRNHGILNDFPETVGNVIIPTDELTPSFFRGVGIPPTRIFHILGRIIPTDEHIFFRGVG